MDDEQSKECFQNLFGRAYGAAELDARPAFLRDLTQRRTLRPSRESTLDKRQQGV
jgi:hypothetical protein